MDQDVLQAQFAQYVAALGRGPGRSRALSRDEARDAFSLVLRGAPDPMQVGAFLMLLRYRGEDPDEITGLVEAARLHAGLGRAGLGRGGVAAEFPAVDLDWPSYGAGRTRTAPWFLLAALALADSGIRVLMHGTNAFSGGMSVPDALAELGRPVQSGAAEVSTALLRRGFAYWPAAAMVPDLDRLLELRRLFGLRSPVNTVARLLDPADATAGVDGVFHPPYIALHLGVAARLRRPALLVLKGGGGEAERPPAKPVSIHLRREGEEVREMLLPAMSEPLPRTMQPATDSPSLVRAVWRGEAAAAPGINFISGTITGTIALALLALRRCDDAEEADRQARVIWDARRPE
jgi:anthranilate phosphoribosyltransferase